MWLGRGGGGPGVVGVLGWMSRGWGCRGWVYRGGGVQWVGE